jgi:hypothetical protein
VLPCQHDSAPETSRFLPLIQPGLSPKVTSFPRLEETCLVTNSWSGILHLRAQQLPEVKYTSLCADQQAPESIRRRGYWLSRQLSAEDQGAEGCEADCSCFHWMVGRQAIAYISVYWDELAPGWFWCWQAAACICNHAASLSDWEKLPNFFNAPFFSFTKLFYFLNCMYRIVCVCEYTCSHVCGHMCEGQNLTLVFPLTASCCISEAESLPEPRVHRISKSIQTACPRDLPSPPPTLWDGCELPCELAFMWALGIWTPSSLMLPRHTDPLTLQNYRVLNSVLDLSIISLFLFYAYEYCACVYISIPYTVSAEARKEHQISRNLSYRQLWAAMWVLGIEPRFSGSPPNYWAISSGPRKKKSLKRYMLSNISGEAKSCRNCLPHSEVLCKS